MTPVKHIAWTAAFIIVALIVTEYSTLDLWIQDRLFNQESEHWLLSNPSPFVRFVFYDGIKRLLIVFGLSIPILLFFFSDINWVKKYRRGMIIVFLSAITIPSTIGILKATSDVSCPKALQRYGGQIPYVGLFDAHLSIKRQRCFPAAHASAGFALMSVYYLFKTARKRKQALTAAIFLGWIMGGYKMLIGDHFFSHTLLSMLIAWLIINFIVVIRCKSS